MVANFPARRSAILVLLSTGEAAFPNALLAAGGELGQLHKQLDSLRETVRALVSKTDEIQSPNSKS